MRKNHLRNYSQFVPGHKEKRIIRNRNNLEARTSINDRAGNYYYQTSIISAYGEWIEGQQKEGREIYLFTVVFKQLAGSRDQQVERMFKDITFVYGRLVTRTTKKHRSSHKAKLLPRAIFFVDGPRVNRRKRQNIYPRHRLPNGGIHVHGLVAATCLGLIKEPLDQHFEQKMHKYILGRIEKIDVLPVPNNFAYVTKYGAKGLKNREFSSDYVLVLPKTLDELPPMRRKNNRRKLDPLKDLQAATNVSPELGLEILKSSK